jgi:hypothetical protein
LKIFLFHAARPPTTPVSSSDCSCLLIQGLKFSLPPAAGPQVVSLPPCCRSSSCPCPPAAGPQVVPAPHAAGPGVVPAPPAAGPQVVPAPCCRCSSSPCCRSSSPSRQLLQVLELFPPLSLVLKLFLP